MPLRIWTVYRAPTDFPHVPYVVRSYLIAGGATIPHPIACLYGSYADVEVDMDLKCLTELAPMTGDDPAIVANWI